MDWTLEVHDHQGVLLATVTVADEPLSGTEALYPAEVNLTAPDAEGLFRWEVLTPAICVEPTGEDSYAHEHESATTRFNVRAVPEADCRLTVNAIDRETQVAVQGAQVVVHPYRAVTNENGVAELSLPRGHYRLFVSGRDFFPLRLDGELTTDMTIRAELEIDRAPSDAELWV